MAPSSSVPDMLERQGTQIAHPLSHAMESESREGKDWPSNLLPRTRKNPGSRRHWKQQGEPSACFALSALFRGAHGNALDVRIGYDAQTCPHADSTKLWKSAEVKTSVCVETNCLLRLYPRPSTTPRTRFEVCDPNGTIGKQCLISWYPSPDANRLGVDQKGIVDGLMIGFITPKQLSQRCTTKRALLLFLPHCQRHSHIRSNRK